MREGTSTHAAAEWFGIAIATAVRWRWQDRAGRSDPLPMGGDRRSGRIEAEAEFLQSLVDGKDDITLHEMQQRLADERGLKVGVGALWRFFDQHGLTWKKDRARERAGAPGSPEATSGLVRGTARPGPPISSPLTVRETRGSRTASRRKWRGAMVRPCEASGAARACRTGTGRRPRSPAPCACQA